MEEGEEEEEGEEAMLMVRVRSSAAAGSLRDRVGVVLRETLIVACWADGSTLYFSKTIVIDVFDDSVGMIMDSYGNGTM